MLLLVGPSGRAEIGWGVGPDRTVADSILRVGADAGHMIRDGFAISEFGHIVAYLGPAAVPCIAGRTSSRLEFSWRGRIISGAPTSGKAPLRSGDRWDKPLVGVPYLLVPREADVRMVSGSRVGRTLSSVIGTASARSVFSDIARVLGESASTVYVNEWGAVFGKSTSNGHRYVCQLSDIAGWFPDPEVRLVGEMRTAVRA